MTTSGDGCGRSRALGKFVKRFLRGHQKNCLSGKVGELGAEKRRKYSTQKLRRGSVFGGAAVSGSQLTFPEEVLEEEK